MRSHVGSSYSPPRLCQLLRRHRVCFSTLAGSALLQQSTPTEVRPSTTSWLRLAGTDHSLSTAYSKEENGIVERANQEVLRHLTAITRVSNAWSYEQLPMVQRIMNTVEKTSTGVTPAELVLTNSIRLTSRILAPPSASNNPVSYTHLTLPTKRIV